jgi:hypothetical protein
MQFFSGFLEGVEFLQGRQIAQMDLKPDNVVVDVDIVEPVHKGQLPRLLIIVFDGRISDC